MRSGNDAARTGRPGYRTPTAPRSPFAQLSSGLVIWAALAIATILAGCSSWIYDENWQTMETEYDVEFSILWDAVKLTLIDQYDTVEYERASEGVLRTGWKQELNFLAGAGVREQATVNVRRGDKGWALRIRVAREANQEPIRTLDPRYAKWDRIEDNGSRAQHLVGLVHIKMKAITEP